MFPKDHVVLPVFFWRATDCLALPSGNGCYIAIENDHRNSVFFQLNMVISHSYVRLPEGTFWMQKSIVEQANYSQDMATSGGCSGKLLCKSQEYS